MENILLLSQAVPYFLTLRTLYQAAGWGYWIYSHCPSSSRKNKPKADNHIVTHIAPQDQEFVLIHECCCCHGVPDKPKTEF